jgi:predicted RNase H-like HicB family nuclease
MKREYAVIFEKGETNWGAIVPELPGCVSLGKTLEEAEHNVKEAIGLYLEVLKDKGLPIPTPQMKVKSVAFDLAS